MEEFDLEQQTHLRQQPFRAPDRYFDDLGMRVQKHVSMQRKPALPLPAVWALRLALPALALAFGLWWLQPTAQTELAQNTGKAAASAIISQVSAEDIQEYLSEDASETEIYDVALSEDAASTAEEDLLLEEVEVEDLESYL